MNKGRLEAFSDGVLAVIITIMVLEMKSPHGTSFAAMWLLPDPRIEKSVAPLESKALIDPRR